MMVRGVTNKDRENGKDNNSKRNGKVAMNLKNDNYDSNNDSNNDNNNNNSSNNSNNNNGVIRLSEEYSEDAISVILRIKMPTEFVSSFQKKVIDLCRGSAEVVEEKEEVEGMSDMCQEMYEDCINNDSGGEVEDEEDEEEETER